LASEVTILPVSKTFGPEPIRAVVALGCSRFGENRLQEIRYKAELLRDCNISWVMIGHLQTNKVKEVAHWVSEVQSLDRLALAEALDRRLQQEGRALDVLIQIKTSPENSKYGLLPRQLPAFLKMLRNYDTLRVQGLMTMAVHSVHEEEIRECFRHLRELRDQAQEQGYALPRLSMGMSDDFPLAIAEGATELRIGSALFGARKAGAT
jgi:pyridoxal phosphate enzyme (YggS family)